MKLIKSIALDFIIFFLSRIPTVIGDYSIFGASKDGEIKIGKNTLVAQLDYLF